MATIKDLKIPELTALPESEAIAKILDIRANRRVKKTSYKTRASKSTKKRPIQKALDSISSDQAALLLEKLKEALG